MHFQDTIVSGKGETIFALTYPNTPMCAEQNRAIQWLRPQAKQLGLRIVEVQLQQ
jgi:hypothetical protein